MDVLSNEIIKTIPRDKTGRVIGQSTALFHPYRRLSFDVTSVVSNESEALYVSTNRNDGAEGLTCCRQPTAIAPQHDAPPISCFCFALWILKVNNAITSVSTVWNGSLRRCRCWSVIQLRFRIIHSVCAMCAIWASLPRTFLSPKSVSVALGVGEQRRGSGFRQGLTRAQRPPTSSSERRVSSAARMESQDAADGPEVHRGFICASFNQDTT